MAEYTVKEIADRMNMTEHTIRFYTDKELLPCKRDANNRRVFNDDSMNWLRGIHCLRSCGVSIEDIKAYSDLCISNAPDALQKRYEFMQKQRKLAYDRLREAQSLVSYMEEKVGHYEDILAGKVPDDTNPTSQVIPQCQDD